MAQSDSISRNNLTFDQRAEVFDKTATRITRQYFDPRFNGTEWPSRAREMRERIISLDDPESFELGMHELVRILGTSHTGFFHQSVRRVPGRLAIGASFRRAETESGPQWIAQDVHSGGPAHMAGLRPLDALRAINGKEVIPPEAPMFAMGTEVPLRLRRASEEITVTISIPAPRDRKQPHSEPSAVVSKRLSNDTGYLKVSILPGLLGLDVARSIDRAVSELSSCDSLVLDLRGHLGGGLGVLRLMSHLTADKLPIGYTVTRKRSESGFDKNALRKLDRLPTHLPNPIAIATMAVQFVGRDPSVLLVSEGLGLKRWHGRVAILVNEHTVSAGEMVAAFAAENGLAKIVGTETAGRLIPGSGFKVGYGYMLVMPKAEYVTWQGQRFEGAGVKPHIEVPWIPERLKPELDNQLEQAVRIVRDRGAAYLMNPGTPTIT
ncbi:MAG TPA: S41 family peptidase [Bryobacteraceae bacterium]|nr:S41 family peptidase [Bryobacteraceae bacterium]